MANRKKAVKGASGTPAPRAVARPAARALPRPSARAAPRPRALAAQRQLGGGAGPMHDGTTVYIVSIELTPRYVIPSNAPNAAAYVAAALEGMDLRFDPATSRTWARLAFDGGLTEEKLAEEINEFVKWERSSMIEDDIGLPSGAVTAVIAVPNGAWNPGGGGLHESVNAVQAAVGELSANWRFAATKADGTELSPPMLVTVHAEVGWNLTTLLP